jgi:uncharacterized RDD family membrane protein YckC
MTNPYAPPLAVVRDIADPSALAGLADRGTRLGATILDTFIFMAVVYGPVLFVTMIGGAMSVARGDAVPSAMGNAGFVPAISLTIWCVRTITYMKRNGQSIAKKVLGIKVVRIDGSPASLGRLFWLRSVVNGLLSMVPLYSFVDALFIFGESRQCLHDRIAGTIVVRA